MESRLYFECHITISPVFDDKLIEATRIAKFHGFSVAELLMQRRKEDTAERSKFDTFMTGRSKQYESLHFRAKNLVVALTAAGFDVWRTKIEDTLLDTKCGDVL